MMRLLVCSNSCPRWDGAALAPRSPGGLVPMVVSLLEQHGGSWIFTAPPGATVPEEPVRIGTDIVLHPLEPGERLREQHYDVVSIQLLLGVLHYMHDTSRQPVFDADLVAAWAGYEEVNWRFAERLAELADDDPDELVLINDPHLMLVPEYFTRRRPDRRNRMTSFLGTPWCEPDYFSLLPAFARTRILSSLLRCDVVGFHAERWVAAFLACCARCLPDATIEGRSVLRDGHRTEVVAIPFPLDIATIDRMVTEPALDRWHDELSARAAGRRVLLRADRLDLWKNIDRGFLAYEQLLERRPELASTCWFAAVVTEPSRARGRHREYSRSVERTVDRINERFAAGDKEAASLVRPRIDDDSRHCVLAGLRMSTAAVVNSTYDGLNLFAKEAAYLLADDATLLLSGNAGVHEQLGEFAVTVDPFDIGQTSVAIERALTGAAPPTSAAPRRGRLREEDTESWLAGVFRL